MNLIYNFKLEIKNIKKFIHEKLKKINIKYFMNTCFMEI